MKLNPLGSNRTELVYNDGTRVFFSYKTPVACYVPTQGHSKTDTYYSVTTSRHINQWLNGADHETISQEYLNNLVAK